jgi:uncharacterized DUF497 family protein
MSCRFEWDDDKARASQIKHGISFDEAATVFHDSLARIFDDEVHSISGKREIIIGHSIRDKVALDLFRRATQRNDSDYQCSFDN